MKNLTRRLRSLEQRLPKPKPAADLQSERAGWRAFVERIVLPAAAGNPAAQARLATGLPELEERVFAVPATPGEARTQSRRNAAFALLGQLLTPHPDVKTLLSEQMRRLIEERESTHTKSR